MTNTVEAGRLGSEHIGKTITVTWQKNLITSTVTDELMSVTHEDAGVTLRFKSTQWIPFVLMGTAKDTGLTVSSNCHITIKENNS